MTQDDKTVLSKIESEIEKLVKHQNTIFFFTIDSKGNSVGSIEYEYRMAYSLKEMGYDVCMLYQEDEFVGVGDWMGKKYAELRHENVGKGEINVEPSDLLIIPEVFTNVMNSTKKLPCKRLVLIQNLNYAIEYTPLGIQYGDYGITECITTSIKESEAIRSLFPYMKCRIIPPYADEAVFYKEDSQKKMVINIVSKNQTDINKVIKPFYWKYPIYKWVSFKDLRNLSQDDFAKELRTNAVTICIDNETNFGISFLQAMASGSLVIGKMPETMPEWSIESSGETSKDGEIQEQITNGCIWFDEYKDASKIIANIVRAWTTDNIPTEIYEKADKIASAYSKITSEKILKENIDAIFEKRKEDFNKLKEQIENKQEKDNTK